MAELSMISGPKLLSGQDGSAPFVRDIVEIETWREIEDERFGPCDRYCRTRRGRRTVVPMEPVWLQCAHCGHLHRSGSHTAVMSTAQTHRGVSEPDIMIHGTLASEQSTLMDRTLEPSVSSAISGGRGHDGMISAIIHWAGFRPWRRRPTG